MNSDDEDEQYDPKQATTRKGPNIKVKKSKW